MFSGIKGFLESHIGDIDTQIAAESRTRASAVRRTSSPVNRPNSRARTGPAPSSLRDPSEFENESDASTLAGTPPRVGTPAPGEPVTEDPLGALAPSVSVSTSTVKPALESRPSTPAPSAVMASTQDLPTDVRVKLRKLEKIEAKHGGTCSLLCLNLPPPNNTTTNALPHPPQSLSASTKSSTPATPSLSRLKRPSAKIRPSNRSQTLSR